MDVPAPAGSNSEDFQVPTYSHRRPINNTASSGGVAEVDDAIRQKCEDGMIGFLKALDASHDTRGNKSTTSKKLVLESETRDEEEIIVMFSISVLKHPSLN